MKRKIYISLSARERLVLVNSLNAKRTYLKYREQDISAEDFSKSMRAIDSILKKIGWSRKNGFEF